MNRTMHNKSFNRYFGTNDIFMDTITSHITGKYCLDVIELDNWLHEYHDYNEEEHGSMKDFITFKFGKEACNFIEGLI